MVTIDQAARVYDSKIEVVVVDNNSTISVKEELGSEKYKPKNHKLIVLEEKRVGPSFARNTGILATKFNHIIFLDDDCEVKQNLFQLYKKAWKKTPKARIIGGKTIVEKVDGSAFSSKEKRLLKSYGWCFGLVSYPGSKTLVLGETLFTANLSMKIKNKHDVFNEKIGRFDSRWGILFAEDFELCTRKILEGQQVYYDNSIDVINSIDSNRFKTSYLLKRHFNAGIERQIYVKELLKNKKLKKKQAIISKYFGFSACRYGSAFQLAETIGFFAGNFIKTNHKKNNVFLYHEKKHVGGGQVFVDGYFHSLGELVETVHEVLSWRDARNFLLRNKYCLSIINTYSPKGSLLPFFIAVVSRTPIMFVVYGFWHLESKSINPNQGTAKTLIFKICQFLLFCFSEKIIVLSSYQRELFKNEFGGYFLKKLKIVPGYVDTNTFKPAKNKTTTREELNLKKDTTVFLWIARLEKRKGLSLAIEGFARAGLKKAMLLVVFPVGNYSHFDVLVEAFRQVRDLGIFNQVFFVTGVCHEDIHKYYQSADVFLMTSTELETFGLTTIEAMASGCLVVGFQNSATTEILKQVDNNLLVRNNSGQLLGERLKKLASLKMHEKKQTLTKGARVAAQYSPSLLKKRLFEVVREIVF